MGVFLNLSIVPDRISSEEWFAVYQETLILLEKFPFLDSVKAGNGYCYAAQSAHRENVLEDYAGWCVVGDMHNGSHMESFFLISDIGYYKKKVHECETNKQDILCCGLSEELKVEEPPSVWVWGAKTQGQPAHLGLLAIGCLLCHRFPDAAYVHGDISAAQCQRSVEWANQYLEEPIDVPVTADAKRLLPRLMASGLSERDILPAFHQLTLEPCFGEVGACLRENFPTRVIEDYYKERLLPHERREGKLYLNQRSVKEYLELGLDFRALCRMVMVDPDGNLLTPRDFLKVLLGMKLHVPLDEKTIYDYVASPKDRGTAEVETVSSMLLRALFAIHGAGNRNVAAHIPFNEILSVFEEVVGTGDYRLMAEELLEEIDTSIVNKNQNDVYDGPESFYRTSRERDKENAEKEDTQVNYDIASPDDVICFEDGDTVEPKLHDCLINYASQLREIGETTYREAVKEMNESMRKKFFHHHYRILIPKEIEDRFFSRIMKEEFIVRYIALYSVEVTDGIYWAIRGFLWNPALLDHYWELAGQTRGDGDLL